MPNISTAQSIAEQMKALMNSATAGTFCLPFTATRKHLPAADLEDLENVTVTVAARTEESTRLNRAGGQAFELTVDVLVQKHNSAYTDPSNEAANVELDELDLLAEQIAAFFGPSTDVGSDASWKNGKRSVISDADELRKNGIYNSVITVVFWRT